VAGDFVLLLASAVAQRRNQQNQGLDAIFVAMICRFIQAPTWFNVSPSSLNSFRFKS